MANPLASRENQERLSERSTESLKEKALDGGGLVLPGVDVGEVLGETGDVSEQNSEDKQVYRDSGFKSSSSVTRSAVKAVQLPTVEVMRKQVAVEIEKEIRILEKEAHKLMSNPMEFKPFQLNGVVSKIRELREMLSQLAFVTAETLRSWWMRFVKDMTL